MSQKFLYNLFENRWFIAFSFFMISKELVSLKKDLMQCIKSFSGPPCETRTHGPQNRNLILYPTELRAVMSTGEQIQQSEYTGDRH